MTDLSKQVPLRSYRSWMWSKIKCIQTLLIWEVILSDRGPCRQVKQCFSDMEEASFSAMCTQVTEGV